MKVHLFLLFCILSTQTLWAQPDTERRERIREILLQRFDSDGDGVLSAEERSVLRRELKARRQSSEPRKKSTLKGLYGQAGSEMAILRREFEVRLPERQKTLNIRVTRPEHGKDFPVIVWSHGMYGSHENYKPLVQHWAKHGYLVLQTSHSDSLKHGSLAQNGSSAMSAMTRDWASRPQDVSSLIGLLSTHSELKGYADIKRVGVGGHSFGAHTTMLVSGAEPRTGHRLSDPRAKVFLAISPQGEGKLFDRDSWKGLRGPLLFISGDNDNSSRGTKALSRRDAFDHGPTGDKALYWIKDAQHSFGGIGRPMSGDKDQPEHVELVKSASLLFWDAKLKGDRLANQAYESGLLHRQARGAASWASK